MPHNVSRSYTVVLEPGDWPAPLFRCVAVNGDLEDFRSNAAAGKPRYWPQGEDGEDGADYLGLSCFDNLKQAMSNALTFDTRRRRGKAPRWLGIAQFTIDPHAGHVYADTFEEGHWTVWAPEEELASRIQEVFPILA